MIKIAGVICGSALAVAGLVALLGMPSMVDHTTPVATIVVEDSAQANTAPAINTTAPEPQPEAGPESISTTTPDPAVTEAAPSDESLVDAIFTPAEKRTHIPTLPEPTAVEEHWYAFWSPFRSEIAANGFVAELQRTTGMDYRVIKQKPGVYEVAFAHDGDTDIAEKLARISTATGLDMPGE